MKTTKPIRVQTKISEDMKKEIDDLAKRDFEGNESQAVRKLLSIALEESIKNGLNR